MECEYELICQNNTKCYRCYDQSLIKLSKQKTSSKNNTNNFKKANSENSWEDLEDQVAQKLNKIPTIQEARRTIASGALPFEKGDIKDTILHAECKERKGREIAEGADKSFTIQKSWLTKAKKEADNINKTMILPFRLKGDDVIYAAIIFDDIAEIVTMYKSIKQENQMLLEQIKVLQEKIKDK